MGAMKGLWIEAVGRLDGMAHDSACDLARDWKSREAIAATSHQSTGVDPRYG